MRRQVQKEETNQFSGAELLKAWLKKEILPYMCGVWHGSRNESEPCGWLTLPSGTQEYAPPKNANYCIKALNNYYFHIAFQDGT